MTSEHKALFHFAYRRSPDQDARGGGAPSGGGGRRGAGRAHRRHRSRAARRAGGAARRFRPHRRWLARHLLCQAHARNPGPARPRRAAGRARASPGSSARSICGDDIVVSFDLLPEEGHKMPAFINLQQFHLEKALVDRAGEIAGHRPALAQPRRRPRAAQRRRPPRRSRRRTAATEIDADWVIAADGARSSVRDLLGLRLRRPHVRGQVPDRRCADGRGLADRAAVLVRPAVPFRRSRR